jgi:hypothetical protein
MIDIILVNHDFSQIYINDRNEKIISSVENYLQFNKYQIRVHFHLKIKDFVAT